MNTKDIYKDDITKLIDGKSLNEVIESLTNLRNQNNGCEILKLKLSTNYRPMIGLYDRVTEIPSDTTNTVEYQLFSLAKLPLNLFIDVTYYKEVFNMDVNAVDEVTIINNLKAFYRNTRNRVFVRYGEGPTDAVSSGCIAGFTIINLDSITSDKLDISVFNPYYTKYLIGKQGTKARQLTEEINKELGYERVKKIFFKEIK